MATTSLDLRPAPYALTVFRGRTFAAPYSFVNVDEDTLVETPIPTDGWTLYGELQRKGENVALCTASFDRNDAEGTGTYSIDGFDELPVGTYSFFIRYTDAAGNKDYAASITFKIKDEAP